jgi:manganese transport protein
MKPQGKVKSVILWSVISAAFIGPGTITTAFTAGSQFNIQLLWAVAFATLACIVLQELSARITIVSGQTFGQAIVHKFGSKAGGRLQWLVAIPVLLGCAAYEAGNILGAVSGMSLLFPETAKVATLFITVMAGMILWKGGSRLISLVMTILVGLMGIAFLVLALQADYTLTELFKAIITPVIPNEGEWLVLALVGTTIVPYNIFIGSAISKGSTVPLMRLGLTISVIIGGLITAWILIAGSITGNFSSFPELATSLHTKMGPVGVWALGVGLFAAGFSSAITSPYAASLIAATVLGSDSKRTINGVWLSVLLIGFLFGISGVRPIPVILTVQALNGFVLPLLVYYLILMVNDIRLIPRNFRHSSGYDLVLLAIFGTTTLMGLSNVDKAITNGFKLESSHFEVVVIISVALLIGLGLQLYNLRNRSV